MAGQLVDWFDCLVRWLVVWPAGWLNGLVDWWVGFVLFGLVWFGWFIGLVWLVGCLLVGCWLVWLLVGMLVQRMKMQTSVRPALMVKEHWEHREVS